MELWISQDLKKRELGYTNQQISELTGVPTEDQR